MKHPVTSESSSLPAANRTSGGFWSFMKTFFVGTAGLALLAVIGTLAGSAWLTANQRAEAEKAEPWANPSFTTTAVTTGGMLARWMDNDGNLENGHSYIKGIYDLWKSRSEDKFQQMFKQPPHLPQLWQIELNSDIALLRNNEETKKRLIDSTVERENREGTIKGADDFVRREIEKLNRNSGQ